MFQIWTPCTKAGYEFSFLFPGEFIWGFGENFSFVFFKYRILTKNLLWGFKNLPWGYILIKTIELMRLHNQLISILFDERKKWAHHRIRSVKYNQGFWIYLYFRIRHSFAHLRPVILSADWSISRLQSWTCSSLPTVAEFVKLAQSIVIEIQRQSTDLYKVHFCEVHSDLRGKGIRVSPTDIIKTIIDRFETHLPLRWLPLYRTVGRIHGWNHNSRFATRSCPPTLTVFIEVIWAYNLLWVLNESEFWSWKSGENFWTSCHKNLILTQFLKYLST